VSRTSGVARHKDWGRVKLKGMVPTFKQLGLDSCQKELTTGGAKELDFLQNELRAEG